MMQLIVRGLLFSYPSADGSNPTFQILAGRSDRERLLPSEAAYTRSIAFDAYGNPWTCYASFPHKHGPYKSGVMVRIIPHNQG